uniref:Uncharacterized protein n=1 Tax=Rhizophora mucronata TaxID=61149 RepID=A0A2P2NDA1_RHIMU
MVKTACKKRRNVISQNRRELLVPRP